MKTTIDLPGDLVHEIKLRALNEGRKLKDTTADLLRKGLNASSSMPRSKPDRVKFPLIKCKHPGELTPEQVASVLLNQEAAWQHEAS